MKKEETNVCETWCNGHLAALLSYNLKGLSLEAAGCPTGSLLEGRREPCQHCSGAEEGTWTVKGNEGSMKPTSSPTQEKPG